MLSKQKILTLCLIIFSNLAFGMNAQAFEVTPKQVEPNVYAYIGPLNDRTSKNLGLNDNIGFVITSKGVVLIDSGAGTAAAKALEKAAHKISNKPIIAIINTGSQDHRWLGNAYFARKGVKIYALAQTVATQKRMAAQLQAGLEKRDPVLFKPDTVTTAPHPFKGDSAKFNIGGVAFELHHYGDAHFPGDAVVWLPKQKVLFSGDLIYVDRMLGIHPWSNIITWQKAYHQARKLPAKWIVPGHGNFCHWAKADKETGAYIDKLMSRLSDAAENMAGVDQAVADNKNWPEFAHLVHYKDWHTRNVSRAYLRIESSM